MADAHVRLAPELAEAAREAGGFDPGTPLPAIVRWSMATAAGWPARAARMAAGPARSRPPVSEEDGDG
jgi:hypothetical protein